MSQTLFLLISATGLFAALGTVLARNLVHAALFLVAFFFVIACQFVMLEAEFLAAIQVLVYIGAVAILMMFGIMLTRNVQGDDTTSLARGWVARLAIAASMGLFLILVFGINDHVGLRGRSDWAAPTYRPSVAGTPRAESIDNMGKTVGDELVNRYAVPFEVAGVLLTAALVGAIALAHRDPEDEVPSDSRGTGRPAVTGDGNGAVSGRPEAVVTTTSVSSH